MGCVGIIGRESGKGVRSPLADSLSEADRLLSRAMAEPRGETTPGAHVPTGMGETAGCDSAGLGVLLEKTNHATLSPLRLWGRAVFTSSRFG